VTNLFLKIGKSSQLKLVKMIGNEVSRRKQAIWLGRYFLLFEILHVLFGALLLVLELIWPRL
jgi:hypothetical protein